MCPRESGERLVLERITGYGREIEAIFGTAVVDGGPEAGGPGDLGFLNGEAPTAAALVCVQKRG
jgi:hypothetical protein